MISTATPGEMLRREVTQMRAFISLLESERDALVENNIARIESTSAAKLEALKQAVSATEPRMSIMDQAGYARDAAGALAWVQQAAVDASPGDNVLVAWQELRTLTLLAKELNRINGLINERHLVATSRSLEALRVNAGGQQTYGPDGQARSAIRRTTLRAS